MRGALDDAGVLARKLKATGVDVMDRHSKWQLQPLHRGAQGKTAIGFSGSLCGPDAGRRPIGVHGIPCPEQAEAILVEG